MHENDDLPHLVLKLSQKWIPLNDRAIGLASDLSKVSISLDSIHAEISGSTMARVVLLKAEGIA